jgi:hypothetical protein
MSCCHHCDDDPLRDNAAYRRILWIVLAINAAMFAVEIGAGLAAGSAALQADALDFFGDAANYGISLLVVGMALRYRAMAAFAKGASMGMFGLWSSASRYGMPRMARCRTPSPWARWVLPRSPPMPPRSGCYGPTGAGTPTCARHGFARATTCSENLAVLLAALGVLGTGTGWPDFIVAAIMAALALQGAWTVIRQSIGELRRPVFPVAAE